MFLIEVIMTLNDSIESRHKILSLWSGPRRTLQYKCVKWSRRLPKNILSDAEIKLTEYYPHQYYPESLRLIQYWDEELNREFTYLTNAKHLSALQVANLYKNR